MSSSSGDGEQAEAELAAPDPGGDGDGQHEQGEQRVVEGPVLVGQRPGGNGQGQALAAAGEAGPDRRDDAEQLQGGERDDDEVHATGAAGHQAEDRRRDRRYQAADQAAKERRHVVLGGEDARGVRAEADEGAVAERDVAGVPAHDVPAGRADGEQERQDQHRLVVQVVGYQREDGERDQGEGDERAADPCLGHALAVHAVLVHAAASCLAARVNSPCGLMRRTRRMRIVGTASDQRTEM